MTTDPMPDMSCVPYQRKKLYLLLTVPFLVLLLSVFVYLWTVGVLLALVFLLLYLVMCYFQAYCCAHQNCPYVGGFCPAVIGILPASLMAKLFYGGKAIETSQQKFEIYATVAVMAWVGLLVFPLFWIADLGLAYAVGYALAHIVYTLVFGLTICPACALRNICPGGQFHKLVLRLTSNR
jgi:hypothetical protein